MEKHLSAAINIVFKVLWLPKKFWENSCRKKFNWFYLSFFCLDLFLLIFTVTSLHIQHTCKVNSIHMCNIIRHLNLILTGVFFFRADTDTNYQRLRRLNWYLEPIYLKCPTYHEYDFHFSPYWSSGLNTELYLKQFLQACQRPSTGPSSCSRVLSEYSIVNSTWLYV